jgi:hypothetical protein
MKILLVQNLKSFQFLFLKDVANKGLKRKNGPGNDSAPKGKVGGGSGKKFR